MRHLAQGGQSGQGEFSKTLSYTQSQSRRTQQHLFAFLCTQNPKGVADYCKNTNDGFHCYFPDSSKYVRCLKGKGYLRSCPRGECSFAVSKRSPYSILVCSIHDSLS